MVHRRLRRRLLRIPSVTLSSHSERISLTCSTNGVRTCQIITKIHTIVTMHCTIVKDDIIVRSMMHCIASVNCILILRVWLDIVVR